MSEPTDTTAAKKWFFRTFPDVNPVLQFVNGNPSQAAGEISATVKPDGSVDLFYLSTQQ